MPVPNDEIHFACSKYKQQLLVVRQFIVGNGRHRTASQSKIQSKFSVVFSVHEACENFTLFIQNLKICIENEQFAAIVAQFWCIFFIS